MRKHPRFPVSLAATMELRDGRSIECLILDLSMGGVGIETKHEVSDVGEFTLRALEPGFELKVHCEVREIRDLWQRRVIHAQFVDLGDGRGVTDAVERVSDWGNTTPDATPIPAGFWSTMRRLLRRRAA